MHKYIENPLGTFVLLEIPKLDQDKVNFYIDQTTGNLFGHYYGIPSQCDIYGDFRLFKVLSFANDLQRSAKKYIQSMANSVHYDITDFTLVLIKK